VWLPKRNGFVLRHGAGHVAAVVCAGNSSMVLVVLESQEYPQSVLPTNPVTAFLLKVVPFAAEARRGCLQHTVC
jgi:hypothetical protein